MFFETGKNYKRARECIPQKKELALDKIKNYLDFIRFIGLEPDESTMKKTEEIFKNNKILDETEKEILQKFYGIFGQKKGTFEETAKQCGGTITDILRKKREATEKIKRYLGTDDATMITDMKSVRRICSGMSDETKDTIKSIYESSKKLDNEDKTILKRLFDICFK